MSTSLRGSLLVASPATTDEHFTRTVVLIGEHTGDGAMGVVLNRPTMLRVRDAAPELEPIADEHATVFTGGPVQPHGVIVLVRYDDGRHLRVPITDDVGFVSAEDDLAEIALAAADLRVFAGHAGWGPGQLDEELQAGGWIVADLHSDDPFSADPAGLWRRVLSRLGGRYTLIARMPDDPRVN